MGRILGGVSLLSSAMIFASRVLMRMVFDKMIGSSYPGAYLGIMSGVYFLIGLNNVYIYWKLTSRLRQTTSEDLSHAGQNDDADRSRAHQTMLRDDLPWSVPPTVECIYI